MDANDITTSGASLVAVTGDEIDAAEVELGATFPMGYRDFMLRFGEGAVAQLRIYPPRRILRGLNNLREWRERIAEFWFWDREPLLLTRERALECIPIADSYDGDELAFHPSEPDRIYFLPRHSDSTFAVEGGLYSAMEWYCSSGILIQPFSEKRFEPFDTRVA